MKENDSLARFKECAAAVQALVVDVVSLQQALQYAVDVTRNKGGTTIAAPGLNPEEQSQLAERCTQSGLTLLANNLRDHIGKIHTGFTLGDWGIAETGTLVLDSTREDIRIATMLSETHVAVLPGSRIRADAMALEPELSEILKSPPRYLAFISGASRTADIERVLTIGVHGPQELHFLILHQDLG